MDYYFHSKTSLQNDAMSAHHKKLLFIKRTLAKGRRKKKKKDPGERSALSASEPTRTTLQVLENPLITPRRHMPHVSGDNGVLGIGATGWFTLKARNYLPPRMPLAISSRRVNIWYIILTSMTSGRG